MLHYFFIRSLGHSKLLVDRNPTQVLITNKLKTRNKKYVMLYNNIKAFIWLHFDNLNHPFINKAVVLIIK